MFFKDVFYIGGFDPRSSRYYYSLFKKNALKTSALADKKLDISQMKQDESFEINCDDAQVNYHFLPWHDVVRDNFVKNSFDLFSVMLIYARFCAQPLMRTYKHSHMQLIGALYPFFYVIFSYAMLILALYFLLKSFDFSPEFLALGAVLFILGAKIIFWAGSKIHVFWLLGIYSFCLKYAQGKVPNEKINDFANKIINTLNKNQNKENYELLVVSHSVGTILAVSVMAKVLELAKAGNVEIKALKLVMLGSCIPLVSFHKFCSGFKAELEVLAKSRIPWYDLSSKIDGACFPLFDYVKNLGIPLEKNSRVKFISVRFFKIYSAKTYKKIRYQWYKVHFLYLMATEIKGGYDFFDLTCAPKLLESKLD